MTDVAPNVVRHAEQHYVGRRGRVRMDTINEIADQLPGIIGWLQGVGVFPTEAPFLRYERFHADGTLEIEAGVPVGEPVAAQPPYHAGTLPAGNYATLLHTGHFDGLRARTTELLDAAEAAGWTFDRTEFPGGEQWAARLEVYLTNPLEQPDPAGWQTELRFRLAD